MFGKKHKREETPESKAAAKVVDLEKEQQIALNVAWREGYDQERSKAKTEGRGCGSCIDGVVRFGPEETDQSFCYCEIGKKKVQEAEPSRQNAG